MLTPETFFHLASFEHADLFDGIEHVWDVLPRLKAYLVANTPVENRIDGHVYPGAIIGDDCQLGCNAVCNPGTLIGPRSVIYPLTSVYGYHPANALLKPSSS